LQAAIIVASLVAAALLSRAEDWAPIELVALLFGLTLLSGAFPLAIKDVKASGAFLGLVLTMSLLGPAPAVVLALLTQVPQGIALRAKPANILCNTAAYVAFCLVGGVAMHAADPSSPFALAAAVFAVFLLTNFLNFLLVALDIRVIDGVPIRHNVAQVFVPVLPVELASGLLTATIAYGYAELGISVIVGLTVAGLVFQYLLHLAFESMRRGEQLEKRTHELASLQVGLLTTVIKTLSLRDKMTARHSAAVARYAREIAREIGMDEREQDIVHTAGLLHDIGKFVFPDSILLADTRLSDADYEIVKSHPVHGAELVAQIEGYGPVAEIIRAHHERIDGRGYPDGLVGDDIPLAARIIAVCDTYDVMTSRDSYRKPISRDEAVAELREVSGSQLDEDIVRVFVRLLEERNIVFVHTDDADFERELDLPARVRDYAEPKIGVLGLKSSVPAADTPGAGNKNGRPQAPVSHL
jgi:putative nucleotidyltransferase with HDIG domain